MYFVTNISHDDVVLDGMILSPGESGEFPALTEALNTGLSFGLIQVVYQSPAVGRGGTTFGATLDFNQSANLALLGDESGLGAASWFSLFAANLATTFPNSKVEHLVWSDALQAYETTVVQAGTVTPLLAFSDTFSVDTADIVGQNPDTAGNPWVGVAGAAGDWSTASGVLTRSADTTVAPILFSGPYAGDQTVEVRSIQFSTVGDGTPRVFSVLSQYVNAQNHVRLDFDISATGTVVLNLYKVIGGVTTNIATLADPVDVPAATPSVVIDLLVVKSGNSVTVTLIADTLTGALLPADSAVLGAATTAGLIGGSGNLVGMAISSTVLKVVPVNATPKVIRLYNGSVASTLDYQQPRLTKMLPVTMDAVFVSASHNYGSTPGPQYYTLLKTFTDQVVVHQPTAAVVMISQNPEKSPSTTAQQHMDWCLETRKFAIASGYSYMKVFEDFVSDSSWLVKVTAQGKQPNDQGSILWASTADNWISSLLMITAGSI